MPTIHDEAKLIDGRIIAFFHAKGEKRGCNGWWFTFDTDQPPEFYEPSVYGESAAFGHGATYFGPFASKRTAQAEAAKFDHGD